jgi:O-antigen/teichoic acid export membrane protein
MILCCTLLWAQGASGRILFGMSKHGTWAIVTISEGVANVILSIILVRPYGIIGDALGTAIPMTCSMLFFMPHHMCKKLDVRLHTFVRESYTLPFLLCVPLVAVLLLMQRWFVPHNYRQLGLQLLIAGIVYGLGLLWAILTNQALRVSELALNGSSAPAESIMVSAPEEIFQRQQDI